jgi:hypothetical protein
MVISRVSPAAAIAQHRRFGAGKGDAMCAHRNGKVRALFAPAAVLGAVLFITMPASAAILYVDDDAPPGGDGLAWSTAFRCLQDALYLAASDPGWITEIRVGQGEYRPDEDEGGHVAPGDRAATFQLVSDLSLLGGYAGYGAPDPDERDIDLYETILTGDLAGDDEPGFVNYDENSYHVVRVIELEEPVVLEGFTIIGGNADGDGSYEQCGGGLQCENGDLTVSQCTLRQNRAGVDSFDDGGAVWLRDSSVQVSACTFYGNRVSGSGGAIRAWDCVLTLDDCVFLANEAAANGGSSGDGGAVECAAGDNHLYITNCHFVGNSACGTHYDTGRGGAVRVVAVKCSITDCRFTENSASGDGGALNLQWGTFAARGCVFEGNDAGGFGGASYGRDLDQTFTGCEFSSNKADKAGGAIRIREGSIEVDDCEFVGNTTGSSGGALDIYDNDWAHVSESVFIFNFADVGGAVSATDGVLTMETITCDMNVGQLAGGVYASRSMASLADCLLLDNNSLVGGGMYLDMSTTEMTDCDLVSNHATLDGGGMFITAGDASLLRCVFEENDAGSEGGGLYNIAAPAEIVDCQFTRNQAWYGGGIFNVEGGPRIMNSALVCNVALHGGGLYNVSNTPPLFVNCLLNGNWSELNGSAAYHASGSLLLVDSTIGRNSANDGDAIYSAHEPGVTLLNCVVWGTWGEPLLGPATAQYCCIQGGYEGEGNIDLDPLFVDPLGADGEPGTEDDDLRLSAGSPCIDAADNTAVPPDELDLDEDGDTEEPIPIDLDGNPRFVDDPETEDTGFGDPPIVDMGAYEYQPPECPADFDGDGDVDTADLLYLLAAWGTGGGDVDGDGDTDTADLLMLLAAWGECP